MKSNRQSFIHGAAILAVSLIIVKILGLVFKIPLTNILGGVGMGYYNTSFMLFSPIYSLAAVSYTHLDVYKRQIFRRYWRIF